MGRGAMGALIPSLGRFAGHTDDVNDLHFSPSESVLASASADGTIKVLPATQMLKALAP